MFDTHMLNETGKKQMAQFKTTFANAAKNVLDAMPDGREKSIFLTKLEEAVFFGAKSIASVPANHDTKTEY
jgi:hypothetical protein